MENFTPPAPELVRGQSVMFEMRERCWKGAVIVFDDAQATIQRHKAHPDRPLLIEVEGTSPTPEQIAVLSNIWRVLVDHFGFVLVSFDMALLPHANTIMGKLS